MYRKQKKSGTAADFFLIVIFRTGTKNEKNISISWQMNLDVQKVIYTHLHVSCQHALLYASLLFNGQSSKWQYGKNSTITAPESSGHSTSLSEGIISKVLSAVKKEHTLKKGNKSAPSHPQSALTFSSSSLSSKGFRIFQASLAICSHTNMIRKHILMAPI